MKKDKKTEIRSFLKQPPAFLKNLLIYIIFLSVFALFVFILIYRYVSGFHQQQEFVYQSLTPTLSPTPTPTPAPTPMPAPTPAPMPVPLSPPELVLLQKEISSQNDRLAQIEANLKQWQSVPQASHQLVAIEILREVLEGHLPLSTFTLYLQKIPEPWAPPILSRISSITMCKTYAQLQDLLVLPPKSHSLWRRVKNFLKSFVRIRKLDAKGHYQGGHLDDVHRALREHNIQQALEAFEKLSPAEQNQLASWKQDAQNRLALEALKQKMLLDLAGS